MHTPNLPHPASCWRQGQQGGLAIVAALILLVILTLAAFGLSSSSLRELATSGTVVTGAKAAEASDAGLDWFITWAHPDNIDLKFGTPSGNGLLAGALTGLRDPNWVTYPYPAGVAIDPSRSWDQAATITSQVTAGTSNEMVFDTTGPDVKQTPTVGNATIQKFDLTVRYLGMIDVPLTSGKSSSELMWQVVSTGTANIPAAGVSFQQRREIIGHQGIAQKK
ncbi:MAG TPA: hypothetical protein VGJ89_01160 [Geothrix sp.]|jgi:hypothetical protein